MWGLLRAEFIKYLASLQRGESTTSLVAYTMALAPTRPPLLAPGSPEQSPALASHTSLQDRRDVEELPWSLLLSRPSG